MAYQRDGRVQTPDLNLIQQIQPAGIPGSTYVRPPNPPRTNNLLQIADGLASVSKGLAHWSASEREKQAAAKAKQDALDAENEKIDLVNFGEMDKSAQREHLATIPDAKRNTYQIVQGASSADDFEADINQRLQTEFNPNTDDILQWTTQRRREAMKDMEPAERAGFIKATDGVIERVVRGHQEQLGKRLEDEKSSGAFSIYRRIVTEGLDKKVPLEEIMRGLEEAKKDTRLLDMTPEQSDALMFKLAQEQAQQGRTDLVEAILEQPRGGRGSLLEDPDYLVAGYDLINASKGKALDIQTEKEPMALADIANAAASGTGTQAWYMNAYKSGFISEKQAASFWVQAEGVRRSKMERHLEDQRKLIAADDYKKERTTSAAVKYKELEKVGGGDSYIRTRDIVNKNGDGVDTLTVKEQREDIWAHHESEVDAEIKARLAVGEDRNTVLSWAASKHLDFYLKNKWVRPEWEAMFSGIELAIGNSAVTKEVTANVEAALVTYNGLKSKAPGLIDDLVKSDSARLYLDAYTFGRNRLGQTPEQALVSAHAIVQRSANGTLPELRLTDDEVTAAIAKGAKDPNMSFFADDAEDTQDMRQATRKLANDLHRAGAPAAEALKEAVEMMGKQYTVINRRAVFTGDIATPPDFKPLAEEEIADIFVKYGKLPTNDVPNVDNLFISPVGETGRYYVFDKDTHAPILDDKGRTVVIRLEDLAKRREDNRAKAQQEFIDDSLDSSDFDRDLRKATPDDREKMFNQQLDQTPFDDSKLLVPRKGKALTADEEKAVAGFDAGAGNAKLAKFVIKEKQGQADYVTKFDKKFASRLSAFLEAAPGHGIQIYSGFRDEKHQKRLWKQALIKYGSARVARKWVAPPGHSNHNKGVAADLKFANNAAKAWAHKNARRFGLNFRMSHEGWHIEPLPGYRGSAATAQLKGGSGGDRLQVADAQTEIEALLSSYAKGSISSGELRKMIPKIAPGYSIEPGGLRGNNHLIPILTPSGTIVDMST